MELNVRVELKVKRRKMEGVKANRDIKEEQIGREDEKGRRREEEEMYGEVIRRKPSMGKRARE